MSFSQSYCSKGFSLHEEEGTIALSPANDIDSNSEFDHDRRSEPGDALILVVDDNHINQLLAKAILDQNGFKVDLANNGHEAVEALRNAHYDCVLMDIQMPVLDGFEATKEIRELPGERKNTPIIAMTANVMDGDRERCIDAGMDDYLAKPIDAEQLFSRVSYWAGKRSPKSGSEAHNERTCNKANEIGTPKPDRKIRIISSPNLHSSSEDPFADLTRQIDLLEDSVAGRNQYFTGRQC